MKLFGALRTILSCVTAICIWSGTSRAGDQASNFAKSAIPQVMTIADLRQLVPEKPEGQQVVSVAGYTRSDGLGGGNFIWSSHNVLPDDNGLTINPVGHIGSGRWERILSDPGVVSPFYYGARCDGVSDDAIAVNMAIRYLRLQQTAGGRARATGAVQLPAKQCTLKTTINSSGLASPSIIIMGTGGSLICQTQGQPCIDAMDSARLAFRDITIYGDKQNMPSIGLQLGRPSPNGSAAGMYLDHVSIFGFFSFAAYYNASAETQAAVKLNASNDADGGYGAVYDGLNHFKAKSAFISINSPQETLESLGDNTCVNCRITSSGHGGIPLWAGGTSGLTFVNSYISNFSRGVGAVLYSWNINPNFDAHFEASQLTSVFLLSGQKHPVIYGLKYREHDGFALNSIFALDQGVQSAALENVEIDGGRIHSHGSWFDNPANYTVSGRVTGVTSAGWVTPGGGFSGTACFATKCVTQ